MVAEFSDIASGKDDRRTGFQSALARCRQLGAVLVAARLDRITRRAHTLSQLLEDGISIRAADMPGADDLMLRIYAAMAQKERELISERTRAALAAAKARGRVLGGNRGYRPAAGPDATAAAMARVRGSGTNGTSPRAGAGPPARRGGDRPRSHGARSERAGRANAARWRRLDPHHRRSRARPHALHRTLAEQSPRPAALKSLGPGAHGPAHWAVGEMFMVNEYAGSRMHVLDWVEGRGGSFVWHP